LNYEPLTENQHTTGSLEVWTIDTYLIRPLSLKLLTFDP